VPPPPVGYYYEPVTSIGGDGKVETMYRLVMRAGSRNVIYAVAPNEEISLSRVTYKLNAAKAKALAALLGEHVKGVVMEVKADGDKFIVTTSPEAQHTVGQMVALLSGADFKPPRVPVPPPAPALPPGPSHPPHGPLPEPPSIPQLPPVPPANKLDPPAQPVEARGKILKVGDKDLMMIDLGSDAGVHLGQKFHVFRGTSGPKYVGQIEIVETEPGRSVAKPVNRSREFQPGDWLLHGLTPSH
jgi:hypothetical protein